MPLKVDQTGPDKPLWKCRRCQSLHIQRPSTATLPARASLHKRHLLSVPNAGSISILLDGVQDLTTLHNAGDPKNADDPSAPI
jgi:hypothetical protein